MRILLWALVGILGLIGVASAIGAISGAFQPGLTAYQKGMNSGMGMRAAICLFGAWVLMGKARS